MKKYNQPIELIVKRPATILQSKNAQKELSKNFKKAGIDIEFISVNKPAISKKKFPGKAIKTGSSNVIVKTNAKDTEVNPWDMAHVSLDSLGADASYIEPNFINEFVVERKVDVPAKKISSKSLGSGKSNDDYDPDWQPHKNIVWHLGDNYSQLKSARDSVSNINFNVRIGHLDTGYSKTHFAIPNTIRQNPLQHNFVDGENPNDAHDPFTNGFMKQPGHGTGTLGILAGTKINIATDDGGFNDFLGGAYFAEVISCRIAESVILIKTNAFADALEYLTQLSLDGTQIHVVSMSMGGAPSRVWADAVNGAYDAGITLVTAAGNNFAGLPTRHVIYPARFGRVIAACGVTNDYKPYYTKKIDEMQGCFGPKKHMAKALSAFTPNSPWASIESGTIRFSGAGTSSATPQIAAAAAIYYRKYNQELNQLPEKWQRVEAVRNALYKSALKKVNNEYDTDFTEYFGNGIIKANDALSIPVPSAASLKKTDEDEVPWFPILNTIFKAKPNPQQSIRLDMFNTELAQLVYSNTELSLLIDDGKRDYDKVSQKKWKQFKDAVISNPSTSITLKKYLQETSNIK
ncbi:MAG: S8/S53 family peptidase [Chitinophagales bacterium]|nr:S8/S53 family peptidase [Chitinophagales bacterium]